MSTTRGLGRTCSLLAAASLAAASACTHGHAAAQDAVAAGRAEEGITLVVLREASASMCPEDGELREQVAARVGRDPFVVGSPTQILVWLSTSGRRFRATVTIGRDGTVEGERVLHDRDCGELVESAALLLSLLVADAPAAVRVPQVPVADAPPPPAAAELELGSALPRASEPGPATLADEPSPVRDEPSLVRDEPGGAAEALVPADGPRFELRVGAGVVLGWLPESAPVLRAGVGLRYGSWSVRAEARGALDAVLSAPLGSVNVSWAGGVVGGCGHLEALSLCGHALVMRSAGVGAGVDQPRADEVLALGVGASVGLGWVPWRWLRVEAEAELDVPLLVPEAELDGVRVWQASPVAAQLGVSASVVLGE